MLTLNKAVGYCSTHPMKFLQAFLFFSMIFSASCSPNAVKSEEPSPRTAASRLDTVVVHTPLPADRDDSDSFPETQPTPSTRNDVFYFNVKTKKCTNSTGKEGLNEALFGQCANFKGKKMTNFFLSQIDFRGSDFRGANFSGSKLDASDFSYSNFEGAYLGEIRARSAKFQHSKLAFTSMGYSQFQKSDFCKADFNSAYLVGSDFTDSNLGGVNLETVTWSTRRAWAVFTGAVYNQFSVFPFNAESFGMVQADSNQCD